jgi:hypothetical protein
VYRAAGPAQTRTTIPAWVTVSGSRCSPAPQDQQQWLATARRAEELGYATLLMPDGRRGPRSRRNVLGPGANPRRVRLSRQVTERIDQPRHHGHANQQRWQRAVPAVPARHEGVPDVGAKRCLHSAAARVKLLADATARKYLRYRSSIGNSDHCEPGHMSGRLPLAAYFCRGAFGLASGAGVAADAVRQAGDRHRTVL